MHVHKEWQQPAHVSGKVSNLMHNHVLMHSLDHMPSDSSMACSGGRAGKCSKLSQGKMHQGAPDAKLQSM